MKRRIVPVPVNSRAKTSMALYKLIKEQENLLKRAKNRKRMTEIVKNMMVSAYANALERQRPSASAYNIRSAGPKIKRQNLKKRLFGNK